MGGQQSVKTVNQSSRRYVERIPRLTAMGIVKEADLACEIPSPTPGHSVMVFPVLVNLDANSQMHLWNIKKKSKSKARLAKDSDPVTNLSPLYFKFTKEMLKEEEDDPSICRLVAYHIDCITRMANSLVDDVPQIKGKDGSLYKQFQKHVEAATEAEKTPGMSTATWKYLQAIPNNVTTYVIQDSEDYKENIQNKIEKEVNRYVEEYSSKVDRLWNITKIATNKTEKCDSYAVVIQASKEEARQFAIIAAILSASDDSIKKLYKDHYIDSKEKIEDKIKELEGKINNDDTTTNEKKVAREKLTNLKQNPFLSTVAYASNPYKSFIDNYMKKDKYMQHVHFGQGNTKIESTSWARLYSKVLSRPIEEETASFSLELIKSALQGYAKHVDKINNTYKNDTLAKTLASDPVDALTMSTFKVSRVTGEKDSEANKSIVSSLKNYIRMGLAGEVMNKKSRLLQMAIPIGLAATAAAGLYELWKGKGGDSIRSGISSLFGSVKRKTGFVRGEVIQAMPKLELAKTKLQEVIKTHSRSKKHNKDVKELKNVITAIDDVMATLSSVLGESDTSSEDFDISDDAGTSDVFVA